MNSWKKVSDSWCVQVSSPEAKTGDVVTVTNRSGEAKTVTLAALVQTSKWGNIFQVAPTPRPAQQEMAVGDLSGVLELFSRTKAKFPAIVLNVPEASVVIRLSVAGARAKVPGSVTVLTEEKSFDKYSGEYQREWLGRVLVNGTYEPSRKTNGRAEPIAKRLRELAQDPAKVASEYGRLTGFCAFCRLPLGGKTPDSPEGRKSLAVGYGRTCAANYGLPWGAEAV